MGQDWEDWGLSLAVFILLVGCFGLGCWKVRQIERQDELLLDNPV